MGFDGFEEILSGKTKLIFKTCFLFHFQVLTSGLKKIFFWTLSGSFNFLNVFQVARDGLEIIHFSLAKFFKNFIFNAAIAEQKFLLIGDSRFYK